MKPVAKPVAHHVHRKAKPLHRHKVVAARKAAAAPARCEILHRDRLFGGPELASYATPLAPADFVADVPGAGDGASVPAGAGFYPTGGGEDSGGPIGVGGGGSGGTGGVISPAPEPQVWMLMISGLLTAGLALRHRRRPSARTAA